MGRKKHTTHGILTRLLALPKDKVFGEARKVRGWEGLNLPSPSHLLLGLACQTGNQPVAKALLDEDPGLLNTPCTPWCMALRPWVDGRHAPVVFDNMSPLMTAIAHQKWALAGFFLDQPGIESDAMVSCPSAQGKPVEFAPATPLGVTLHMALHHDTKGSRKRAKDFAACLLDKGVNPFQTDPDGNSVLSTLFKTLARSPGAYPEKFIAVFRVLEMLLPHMKAGEGSDWLPGSPGFETMQSAIRELSQALPGHPPWQATHQQRFLMEHTGLPEAPVDELLIGWLFREGLTLDVFGEFATRHLPVAGAFHEGRVLSVLPVAEKAPKPSRL